jgi:hypothetical protein
MIPLHWVLANLNSHIQGLSLTKKSAVAVFLEIKLENIELQWSGS